MLQGLLVRGGLHFVCAGGLTLCIAECNVTDRSCTPAFQDWRIKHMISNKAENHAHVSKHASALMEAVEYAACLQLCDVGRGLSKLSAFRAAKLRMPCALCWETPITKTLAPQVVAYGCAGVAPCCGCGARRSKALCLRTQLAWCKIDCLAAVRARARAQDHAWRDL